MVQKSVCARQVAPKGVLTARSYIRGMSETDWFENLMGYGATTAL